MQGYTLSLHDALPIFYPILIFYLQIRPKIRKILTSDLSFQRVQFWRYGILNIFVTSLGKTKNAYKSQTTWIKITRITSCVQQLPRNVSCGYHIDRVKIGEISILPSDVTKWFKTPYLQNQTRQRLESGVKIFLIFGPILRKNKKIG